MKTGKWLYGCYVNDRRGTFITDESLTKSQVAWWHDFEVSPDTVGQYTGLHDKDGREIYEGDIIRWGGRNYVVRFWNGMFYASVVECNEEILVGYPLWIVLAQEDIPSDIIGNVTDNPELLKGGKR